MRIQVKRVYDAKEEGDGLRILVDRLWPRGVSKDAGAFDLWLKEVAPSPVLRQWFGHDPDKWSEFRSRYESELRGNSQAVERLEEAIGTARATLLYAAKDTRHNHAVALRDFLMKRQG